ncbi:hypothetical protein, partial [Candidatus Bacteroides intestinigallinarum]|uniref:hypothetical protein n=1 Tax=Candidatus Bacteroides intestinigallinarum TaxID=2838470 RepID=UPI0039B58DD1
NDRLMSLIASLAYSNTVTLRKICHRGDFSWTPLCNRVLVLITLSMWRKQCMTVTVGRKGIIKVSLLQKNDFVMYQYEIM